jgi:hypothetical protein
MKKKKFGPQTSDFAKSLGPKLFARKKKIKTIFTHFE